MLYLHKDKGSAHQVRLPMQNVTTEHYFPLVLFIMLYSVALTFESVDEIFNCDHANESNRATTFFSVALLFCACGRTPKVPVFMTSESY